MAQTKLSIAFILAAAAIAPIVAQPIHESHEFSGDVVPHRHPHHPHHHRHHHHHHHQHHGVAIPEQSPLESTSDTTPPPSPREFVDEFEAREYADYDEMFERDSAEAESAGHALPHALPHFKGPFHFGHGPVVIRPHNRPFTHGFPFGGPGLPFRGHGPVVFPGGPFKPFKHPGGHGPVVHPGGHGPVVHPGGHGPVVNPGGPIKPIKHTRLHFGPGPIRLPHEPSPKPMIVDREYIDIEDVVERDFEDDEFEARDFDEELYLD